MLEKRQRERIEYAINVTLLVGDKKRTYPKTSDISMNGIFIITEDVLEIDTTGKINITLSFGEEQLNINAEFKVARVITPQQDKDKCGMGVNFTSIDSDSSINLFNIIKAHDGKY